jgi:osmotically-inducible protein OsmY
VKKEQCPHPDEALRARVSPGVGAQKKGKLSGLGFWPDSEASCDVHASVMDETNVKSLSNTLHVNKWRESVQEWP